ncbi:protein phosphatase 2C domain-containing protein [Streptomyces sp. M54]|uniref:protein phosphatase 2C domain-containing protein n=1 Tax=Streptomyces sp. M54 TaxID=2759525 RepID=UPI001A8FE94F|nr:protein phosphatase 2C domain-containing protein [Streptomyces sp. M54]QSS93896.1 protein phosphatase 2C domain-containing protein [Streptomyces sp. M54]
MSQQGEKPAAHEDDWWRKLYDESAPDAGPGSGGADSLEDRFDSVSDAVGGPVDDHRDTARDTYAEAYEGPDAEVYEDPYADRYEEPEPDRDEEPDRYEAPERDEAPERGERAYGGRGAPASPEAKPAPVPDHAPPPPPPVGTPVPGAPDSSPPSDPRLPLRPPPPLPPRAPGRASAPPPPPVSPPPPPSPRTAVFPAPWEAPGGRSGPRTFAAPRAPEPAGPGRAADAGAPHGPPSGADAFAAGARPAVGHLGERPPTYDAEPAALPSATSENLDTLVPDTVLDGARYGTYTLRTASVRGDSARFRGEPRRDGLLTARFGTAESALVLVALAGGRRGGEAAHLAAADACRWIGGAVARSHLRLSEDIRAGRRSDLKSGLHRLTDRTYGKLRARAAELGVAPDAYTANLRCLLLSADPECRTRVFFGVGGGGLFRLRDGLWQDLEPVVQDLEPVVPAAAAGTRPGDEPEEGPDGDRLTMDLQITSAPAEEAGGPPEPAAEPFRFRASVARPGDTLMLCGSGLAEPMRGEPELPAELADRWGSGGAPGLPAFLADVQLRVKGYADDRTCAAVWEA